MSRPQITLTNVGQWGGAYLGASIVASIVTLVPASQGASLREILLLLGVALAVALQGAMVRSVFKTLQNNQNMLHYMMALQERENKLETDSTRN